MRLWTWAEIRQKVENDLDLQGEELASRDEMLGYGNEAIDEAEAVIHDLAEDYFFTKKKMTMVVGESILALPTDIYASKIRALEFWDGTDRYTIRRIKELETVSFINPTDPYRWLPTNKINDGVITDHGPKVELFPPSRHAGNHITCYYLRNSRRLVADADECDIPEFTIFVINFVKFKCAVKEQHPGLQTFKDELDRNRGQMVKTLSEMIPDGDNEIVPDLSAYTEHV